MKSSIWVGYALAVGLAVMLGREQLKLKVREGEVWWASTGRDVLNVMSMGCVTVGSWGLGLTLPVSFAVAAVFLVMSSAIQDRFARWKQPRWGWLLSWFLGLGMALSPQTVERAMRWIWSLMFTATNESIFARRLF